MKKNNKKGFTLAELLVVVAIIAILVAVSIPIFTGKLNDAKKNTDLANERAAKAAAVTAYLYDTTKTGGFYDAKNGKLVTDEAAIAGGYNKYEDDADARKDGADKAIVKVTVTAGATEDEDPTVDTEWVAK